MRNPEIKTQLTPPSGMRHVYKTTIGDEVSEVVGRGPTPEACEAAQLQWDLAQLCDYRNSAAMYP